MDRTDCDVLIIGMGMGAVALARRLIGVRASVAMLPGAGRPRFNHLDGGIVEPRVLREAIGPIDSAPIHQFGENTVFQRDQLESWAVSQIADSVSIIEDFEEVRAIPHDTGRITVTDTTGERSIVANSVVLTEGANPKIGIAARLRADFDPEDMIHFGRTLVSGGSVAAPSTGSWRTSWNMPAWYSVIPHPDGALVSASVRIENVMRAGRDGRVVLADFLNSPLAGEMGISGVHGEVGMELVPLKPRRRPGMLGAHNLTISLDANGSIDARALNRFNIVLSSGMELGAMMASEWPNLVEWDETGIHRWDVFTTARTPYHDDRNTGFIEDGSGPHRGLLGRLFKR